MSIPGTNQKIYGLYLYLSDWKPNNGSGGTVTSVERPVRIELKGRPVTAQDVFFKVGYPYCFLKFNILGTEFSTLNSAGLTTLQNESHYPAFGVIQLRKEDGYEHTSTAIVEKAHIYSISGNRWVFVLKIQKFDTGIDNEQIDPYTN